jgi:copper(I)-binding protein
MTRVLTAVSLFWCLCLSGFANADQIRVSDAWTRASAPGQNVAAVYFDIVSAVDAKLVAIDTDIAQVAEFHHMMVDGGTMRMRAVPAVDLPAGITVSLKPGGFHVMLFGLEKSLRAGERIAFELSVEDVNGRQTKLKIQADVRNLDASKAHQNHD